MATATAERTKALPSFVTPAGEYSVENPHSHDDRQVFADLPKARTWATTCSSFDSGYTWHVFDDHGRVAGRARDGAWRGAVA